MSKIREAGAGISIDADTSRLTIVTSSMLTFCYPDVATVKRSAQLIGRSLRSPTNNYLARRRPFPAGT